MGCDSPPLEDKKNENPETYDQMQQDNNFVMPDFEYYIEGNRSSCDDE